MMVTSVLASMKRISENLWQKQQSHHTPEVDAPLVRPALRDKLVCNLCLPSTSKTVKKVNMAVPDGR
jgi:hypothetical protein